MAWKSHFQGWSVALIDRLDSDTSSRIAAGLVTPVTGSRGAASWRWDDFYPMADRFYRRVEATTGESFWHVAPAIKVFGDQSELDLYQKKWIDPQIKKQPESILASMLPSGNDGGIRTEFGVCYLEPAARIDPIAYLRTTQVYFQSIGSFIVANIDCNQEIEVNEKGFITIASLKLSAKRLVFCQGFCARENRFFDRLPLHPARGDIIQVESPHIRCSQVVHSKAWAVPLDAHQFLVGATYDRIALHNRVDDEDHDALRFRLQLMNRWESMAMGTFENGEHRFIKQRSAIRPASYDRHPLIGPHHSIPNVYCLNGLGSKGTLLAPGLAQILIDAMGGADIHRSLLWTRRK